MRGSSSSASSTLERQRLPEHGRGLRGRQRRRGVEEAERLREHAVEAVAELVREREDRAAVARVVHQDVGVDAGDGRRAERAGALVGPHGAVDPVVVEEARDDLARPRPRTPLYASTTIRRASSHGVLTLSVDTGAKRSKCSSRSSPSSRAFEPVVALRDVVAARRRLDERLDRLVGRLVREVARGDPRRIAAQPVVDRLVLQDRVEDERPACGGPGRAPP